MRGGESDLTERQVEICKGVAQGKGDKQIAADLGISEGTVAFHLGVLFRRAKIHTRLELTLWFLFLSPGGMRRLRGMAERLPRKRKKRAAGRSPS